jgi:hypothetical protein
MGIMKEKLPAFAFTKIRFLFDHQGQMFAETSLDGKVISAEDVGAEYFNLSNNEVGQHRGVMILACYPEDVSKHMWNENGDPPSHILTMINPTIHFLGQYIDIVGLEYPNLMHGGLLMPPYRKEDGKLNYECRQFREMRDKIDPRNLAGIRMQRLTLF